MNKVFIFGIVGLFCFALIFVTILNSNNHEIPDGNNKYIGWVRLGLAPSAEPRVAQQNDINTGIKFRSGDETFSLMESRTWKTLDYGDTFLTRD